MKVFPHDSRRPDGALLAGVCARIAQRLGWNVWAIRGLFILGLFIQSIATVVLYAVLAMLLPLVRGTAEDGRGLSSPELSDRDQRIADLERRFRDLEKDPGKN